VKFDLPVGCWVRTSAGAHIILSYVIVVVSSSPAIPEEYLISDHKRFLARGIQFIACRYSVLRHGLNYLQRK
jgi:hypothetical protein